MKVMLKKDVLLGDNSLGHAGKSYTVAKPLGLHLVQEGFAEAEDAEGAEAAEAAPAKPKKAKITSHATAPAAEASAAVAGTVETTALGTIETK